MSYSRTFLNTILICFFSIMTGKLMAAQKGYYEVKSCQSDVIRPVVQLKGDSLPVNQVFTLEVQAPPENQDLQLLSFDAVMPAHNHGMVLKPKIFKEKNNSWRIEGVKLHMAGDWQFVFSWQVGASKSKTFCKIHI